MISSHQRLIFCVALIDDRAKVFSEKNAMPVSTKYVNAIGESPLNIYSETLSSKNNKAKINTTELSRTNRATFKNVSLSSIREFIKDFELKILRIDVSVPNSETTAGN